MKKSKELTPWQVWIANPEAIDELCDAIVNGQSMTAFAEGVGASKSMLSRWIAADEERSACVREARIKSAATFDELALQRIDEAGDPFELSKAKEAAHHLRWRASKISPAYGDKVDLKHSGGIKFERIEAVIVDTAG